MRAWLEYRPKGRNFANENNSDRRRKRQNEALNFIIHQCLFSTVFMLSLCSGVYFFVSRQRSKWVWARPSKKINNPF
jgi:hypothetical protein